MNWKPKTEMLMAYSRHDVANVTRYKTHSYIWPSCSGHDLDCSTIINPVVEDIHNIGHNYVNVVSVLFIGFKEWLACCTLTDGQSNKKTQLSEARCATAYTVPVAVLTFKVMQGQWFSCHLKGICDFLLVINSNFGHIDFTVSKIWPLIAWNLPLKIAAKPLQMESY